ncbi:Uncharacterised protein [Burkholderia pseudomallei]|nr:Uncharacterised protein [Burkholderia pseudomallei]
MKRSCIDDSEPELPTSCVLASVTIQPAIGSAIVTALVQMHTVRSEGVRSRQCSATTSASATSVVLFVVAQMPAAASASSAASASRERRCGKIQVVSSPIIRPVVALLRPKPGSRDEVPTYEDFASCTLTPPMSTLPPTHGSFTK